MIILYLASFLISFEVVKLIDSVRQYRVEAKLNEVLIEHYFDYHTQQLIRNTKLQSENKATHTRLKTEFQEFRQLFEEEG